MAKITHKRDIDHNLMAAAQAVPHQVRLVKLSKTQLKVLDSIRRGEEVTAQQISERCDLSASWSSSLLKMIWERGYLNRVAVGCDFGGLEYFYKLID
ncbi:TPA: MarR family transcriptional regulator [Vibrio vulnificus]